MDGNLHRDAGDEWAYCRRLAYHVVKADVESLFISIFLEDTLRWIRPTSQQVLAGLRTQSNLDECLGLEAGKYDVRYEAYSGATSSLEIPDATSLSRLLNAIRNLKGPPVPCTGFEASVKYPPLLRFLARPKDWGGRGAVRSPSRGRPSQGGHGGRGQSEDRSDSRRRRRPGRRTGGNRDGSEAGPSSQPGRRTGGNRDGSDAGPSGQVSPQEEPPVDPPLPPGPPPPHNPPPQPDVAQPSLPLLLPARPELDRSEITFDQRVKQRPSEGLNKRLECHKRRYHNLYANIAGISRDRIDAWEEGHGYQAPYSRITLNPHQTYPAGWFLAKRERMVHYLADRPGMGKTFEAVEIMVRVMFILSNKMAIEQEWDQLDTSEVRPKHIHDKPHHRFGIMETCSAGTQEKYGFVCQCVADSVVAELDMDTWFSTGYMLVMAPAVVATGWEREIRKFLLDPLPTLPHSGRPIQIVNVVGIQGVQKTVEGYMLGQQGNIGLGTILITSYENALTTVSKAFARETNPVTELHHQPSIIVWDEAHLTRNAGNNPIVVIKGLMRVAQGPVHLVAVSGTPLSNGPEDFKIIEGIATDADLSGGRYTGQLERRKAALMDAAKVLRGSGEVASARRRQRMTPDIQTIAFQQLKNYDEACWNYTETFPLLQRGGSSDYFGTPVPMYIGSPPTVERFEIDISEQQRPIMGEYKRLLRSMWLAAREKDPNGDGLEDIILKIGARRALATQPQFIDASIAGFAPGLSNDIDRRDPDTQKDKFRSEEVKRIFGNPNTPQREAAAGSEYWDLMGTAFRVKPDEEGLHPKIERICAIIDEMLADETKHDLLGRGEQHLPKKAIICVPTPWEGFLLTTYLFWRYGHREFTFVGSGMSTATKDRLLAPFTRDPRSRVPEDDNNRDPIALISTLRQIGTSLNLIRCSYCIATSPLRTAAEEAQLFARMNRIGQVHETHGYVLFDKGNPTDVMSYHGAQGHTVLTITDNDRGSGYNFLFGDLGYWDEPELPGEQALDVSMIIEIPDSDVEDATGVEESEVEEDEDEDLDGREGGNDRPPRNQDRSAPGTRARTRSAAVARRLKRLKLDYDY